MSYYNRYLKELNAELINHEVPNLIKKLVKFEKSLKEGDDYYHERFQLRMDDIFESTLDANYVEESEPLLSQLVFFASADVEGGSYGFWLAECDKIEDAPIVYLSTDAQQEIVASNLEDFITLLSNGKTHFSYNEEELNDYVTQLPAFRKWIKEDLGLEILTDDKRREEIETKAKNNYQDKFDKWLIKNDIGFLAR